MTWFIAAQWLCFYFRKCSVQNLQLFLIRHSWITHNFSVNVYRLKNIHNPFYPKFSISAFLWATNSGLAALPVIRLDQISVCLILSPLMRMVGSSASYPLPWIYLIVVNFIAAHRMFSFVCLIFHFLYVISAYFVILEQSWLLYHGPYCTWIVLVHDGSLGTQDIRKYLWFLTDL